MFQKHGKDTSQLETAQANELNGVREKYRKEKEAKDKEVLEKEQAAIKAANEKQIALEDQQFELQQSLNQTQKEKEIADLVKSYEDKFAIANGNAELEKQLTEQQKKDIALIEEKYRKEKEEKDKETAEKEKALKKRNHDFAVDSTIQGLNTIASVTELFGKKSEKQAKRAFQVQKAAQVASALINTYQSATGAYASQFLPVPDPTSPVRGGIAAGLAVAAGLVNVAKIASQKFESPSPGGNNPPPGNIPGGQMAAPQFQTIGTSGVNQLATLQQQPTKAYVVSGEVTSAQSLDRNRVQNATL